MSDRTLERHNEIDNAYNEQARTLFSIGRALNRVGMYDLADEINDMSVIIMDLTEEGSKLRSDTLHHNFVMSQKIAGATLNAVAGKELAKLEEAGE